MPKPEKVIVQYPDQGKSVSLGPNRVTVLLSGKQTGGRYSLTEFAAAPPTAPGAPIHRHKAEDEAIYVRDGEFALSVEDRTLSMPAGSFVLVPKNTWHTIVNAGDRPGRLLIILTPPGFERYWQAMAQLLADSAGQPDPAVVSSLQEKYNMDTGGQTRRFTGPRE